MALGSTFGRRVRARRIEKGLLLKDLAKAIGCTVVYLSEIELDRKAPPSLDKVKAIADVLELEEQELRALALASRPRLELDLEDKPERYQPLALALARSWNDLTETQVKKIMKALEDH